MLAATTSTSVGGPTTTVVPRIVGDPLPTWVVVVAGLVLLVVILAASLWARARFRPG